MRNIRFLSLDQFEACLRWPRPVAVQKAELVLVHFRRNGLRQIEIEAGLWYPSALLVAVVDNPQFWIVGTADSYLTPNIPMTHI